MKRKTIAMCVTAYDIEYESMVVKGVYERCKELGINLLCFAPMTKKLSLNYDFSLSDSVIRGEVEIFNLINFDLIDGLLLMGESFVTRDIIPSLVKKAKEKDVPVINLNDTEYLLDHNLIMSDKDAMKLTVRHLIEEHGKKRIGFIGGFPGNIQTEDRIAAYKSVLAEKNIPIDEKLITYGEFWKKSIECTEELMKLEPKPDAIACASDTMALFCMDKLRELGYRIPEDVAVTGFDGIKDCDICTPRLTSVKRDHKTLGVKAVDLLTGYWKGEEIPETSYVGSMLIVKESCGCTCDDISEKDFYTKRYSEINRYKEFNSNTIHANALFADIISSRELFAGMGKSADFFPLKRMFICISPEYEQSAYNVHRTEAFVGLSDKMLSMVKHGHDIPEFTKFSIDKLVPMDILNEEEPVFFAFSPLYFKNRSLGYVAFEPMEIEGEGNLFGIWLLNVSHNVGSFYMNKSLEKLYVRDYLTGLLNRHGMERFGAELLEQAKAKHTSFTVICADVDGLKTINDTYGHEAGDNAIKQTSIAIRCSMAGNGICIRTGGDEFCVFVAGSSENEIEGYIKNIGIMLEEYNRDSNLPYKVNCSCGYTTAPADETDSLADIINKADERMYEIKSANKAARTGK